MKNMNLQNTADTVMVSKKHKNANSSRADPSTKASLQDGGASTGGASPASLAAVAAVSDRSSSSSGSGGGEGARRGGMEGGPDGPYPPNSGPGDGYGKMNDNMGGPGPMANYNSGYMRGPSPYGVHDPQHGSVGNPNTGDDFSQQQQNSQYNHPFGQQNMRGGNYPGGSGMPRGSPMPNSMQGMMPANYNPGQQSQRPFMSGPSIQQQGGSTPTLNQLLQNPNPTSRYPGSYGDYGMTPQSKGGGDSMNSNQHYGSQGWNQQRPISPYQSQMQGASQSFPRSQGPMFEGGRRHGSSNYPPQPTSSGQFSGQNQYSPNSPQRYPMGQPRMGGPQYPQQDSVTGTGSSDDVNSDSNSTGTNSRPTPTPTPTSTPGPPHSGAPLRPVPSPAGSTGSRSNTPASVAGGTASGSPMPPRPPSNQLDGPQGRITSPMTNQQGYPGQPQGPMMMPPPMGPTGQMMYPGPNKMNPNSAMNFNSQYPNQGQGNYRGMPNMNFSGQQNSFNGPTMSMPNQYNSYGGPGMGMSRGGSGGGGPMGQFPSQYPPSSANNMGGPPMNNSGPPYNNQYGSYGAPTSMPGPGNNGQSMPGPPSGPQAPPGGPPTSSSSSGTSASPGPSGGVPSPCPKGAQAAAHAAMMAAANQSASKPPYNNRSRSPSGGSSSQPLTPPSGTQSTGGGALEPPPQSSAQRSSSTPHSSSSQHPASSQSQSPQAPSQGPPPPHMASHQTPSSMGPDGHPSQSSAPPPGPTQSHPTTSPHQPQHPGHPPHPGHPSHPGHPPHPHQQAQHPNQHPGQPPYHPHSSQHPQHPSQPQQHPSQQQQPSQPPQFSQHPSQPPHHPGMSPMPGSGPSHMHQGQSGMTHPGQHQRMYGPGPSYPGPPHQMNHTNFNNAGAMNQMGGQMPSNHSGDPGAHHYSNSVDSVGPGPPYGPMGSHGGPMGHPMGGHPRHNDMTNTHGMSGGCVSVAPNSRPTSSSHSAPPDSIPMNSMCDMNNGIPPNAMAPPMGQMGHGMKGPHYVGPDGGPHMPTGPHDGPRQHEGMSDVDCKPAVTLASTIAGDSSTTVTQSINTPLTNAMENKPTMALSGPRVMGPPPPRTTLTPSQVDSSSQDSHSSSQDSDSEKVRIKMEVSSHPPTPASQVAPSPVASIHDDLDNISSPSWPGTPKPEKIDKSPFNDTFHKQMDFGMEHDRRGFLERLFLFMLDKGCPITAMPTISKQPIDLYRLYHLVKERGGMVDVTKNKKWRDVSGALNIGASSSAGFTLRKNYAKFLFPLECKFDRGDVDPVPILASLETPSKKDSKKNQAAAAAASQNMQDPYRQQAPPYGNYGGGMRHPQMGGPGGGGGPGDIHGPMMPPNVSMMPNNMPYDQAPPGGMMGGNSNMMPNNMGMGPNNSMPTHNNMGNSGMNMGGMPNSRGGSATGMMSNSGPGGGSGSQGDSISAQNPFADSPSSSYPPHGPPYSANMSQGPPSSSAGGHQMPNSFGGGSYGSRMSGFPGMNQGPSSGPPPSSTPSSSAPSYPDGSRMSAPTASTAGDSLSVGSASSGPTSGPGSDSFAGGSGSQGPSFGGLYNSHGQSGPNTQGPFSQATPPQPSPPTSQPFTPGPTQPGGDTSGPTPTPTPPLQANTSSDYNSRSEQLQAVLSQPPVSSSKPAPPQLHSTDSNSSTGSTTMRPPSQPPTQDSQPPSAVYPGSGGSGPYAGTTPASQVDSFGGPQGPPHMSMMGQTPYNQGPRPYGQEPGFQGYHNQAPGQYPTGKVPPSSQPYGPTHQPFTPPKVYPDHRRDGYNMTPEMMSGRDVWSQQGQRKSGSYNPLSMAQPQGFYKRPHLGSHSPMHNPMSPHRVDKRFMQQLPKMPGGPTMHRGGPLDSKKEIVFPPGCVESTRPQLMKRRKLRHRDIGQTDPWRLMMALKSGLLVESTWALDTLSILLFDDNTVAWFGLQHLPGLIEILLDHFRRCLVRIFDGDFEEMEIGAERRRELDIVRGEESLYEFTDEVDELELPECTPQPKPLGGDDGTEGPGAEDEDTCHSREDDTTATVPMTTSSCPRKRLWKICTSRPDPEKLKEPRNFTLKTRDGKLVHVEENSPDEWMLKKKHWDIYDDFESSTFDWQLGRGDSTQHIFTNMESEDSAAFFRKCFFRKGFPVKEAKILTDVKSPPRPDPNQDLEDIKEELRVVGCSTPRPTPAASTPQNSQTPPTDNSQDSSASSPMPILPHVGASPKCDTETDPKTSAPTIKTEPMDCDNEQLDAASSNVKEEKRECSPDDSTPSADKSTSVKEEAKAEAVVCQQSSGEDTETSDIKSGECKPAPSSNDGNNGLSVISTSRQLNELKRQWTETELEGESYQRDELPFMLLPESLEEVSRRCICVSNIFRSLSFIPGNDLELSKHPGLMLVLGRLLLLHHTHPARNPEHHKFDREVEMESGDYAEDSRREWWWDTLDALRENTLVTLANISGQVSLISYPEEICLPILDGLLHWLVCPSAYAQDPLPTMSPSSVLSPQRLVLEALCKLCITDANVDLVLATPPFSRIIQLLGILVQLVADQGDQVMREFAIVLLSSLVAGEASAARAVALHHPSVSLLLNFIETAESQAVQVANTHAHGISMLQENPEIMGTSLDMLRRTASILRSLSEVPDNRKLFQHHQHRLLHLVMSQILDHRVAAILSDVLYNCAMAES